MDNSTTADKVLKALEPFDVKLVGPNQYRSNSPLRLGSNSHAFALTIDPDGEHGAYHDHVSGEYDSLYDLADLLGIAHPSGKITPVASTKRAYKGRADYAAAHFIPESVISDWIETTYPWADDKGRPCLEFPTKGGKRYRFLDGIEPRYKSPGCKPCLYGLERAIKIAQQTGQRLIFCNGEISVRVAQHYGLAAFTMPGGEKEELPADILAELKAGWTGGIDIILDCDNKGRKSAREIRTQLKAAGYDDVRALDLMLGENGDLADFCGLYREAPSIDLLKLPELLDTDVATAASDTNNAATPFVFTKTRDVLNRLKPTWLYSDEIPSRALITLTGPSGNGKTFVAIDYAFTIARDHNVLYVAAERPNPALLRGLAWMEYYGENDDRLVWYEKPISLMDSRQVEGFINAIKPMGLELIVFDTLARCIEGADVLSNKDMQIAMGAVDRIKEQTGATVMPVHHTGWEGTREKGASAIRDYAEGAILVKKDGETITISCNKMSNSDEFEPRQVQIIPVGEQAVVIPAEQSKQSKNDGLSEQETRLLETLASQGFAEAGAGAKSLYTAANIPQGSFYRIAPDLITRGYIQQATKGAPYIITTEGLKAITPLQLSALSKDSHDSSDSSLQPPTISYQLSHPPIGVIADSSDSGVGIHESDRKSSNGMTLEELRLAASGHGWPESRVNDLVKEMKGERPVMPIRGDELVQLYRSLPDEQASRFNRGLEMNMDMAIRLIDELERISNC
jgi:hypothetical protein